MKAKDYLLQIIRLDTMIQNKIAEKEHWWSIAVGINSAPAGDRVQSSGSQQKMADAVDKYMDIEAEIDNSIDKLIALKQEIISVIEQLPTTEYDVLHKMYVQGMTFYEVAEAKNRTYSWCTSVHGRALKSVQEILKGMDDGKEKI